MPKLMWSAPEIVDMAEPGRDTSGVTTRVVVLYVREHGGDRR
jgi:hypothetical protein